jgi:hypothetical protein
MVTKKKTPHSLGIEPQPPALQGSMLPTELSWTTKCASFNETYEVTVMKVENKIVHYKEIMDC